VNQSIRYVDLFAGCGGLSEGFESFGGYRGIAHVEWEASPCRTLISRLESRWNYKDASRRVLRADMRKLESLFTGAEVVDWPRHVGLDALISECEGIDLLIGGPPCQAYSMAGRVRDEYGMQRDYRNFLFESYLAVVERYSPRAVLFENVPGMLSAKPGGVSIPDRIRVGFRKAGYVIRDDLRSCVFNAADFGVPQQRKRVIILGVRGDMQGAAEALESFYEALASSKARKQCSVAEAIGHLPQLMPLRKPQRLGGRMCSHMWDETGTDDHVPRFHSLRDQAIFRMLAQDLRRERPKYATAASLRQLYTAATGRVSAVHKYHVLRPGQPSNLIPAHLHKDGLRHIHFDPAQSRSITVREAALLQGFSPDFRFFGSQGDKYKMIGNAVPPLFAQALAAAASRAVFADLKRGVTTREKRRATRNKSHSSSMPRSGLTGKGRVGHPASVTGR
jgi:DNA-cytosine methyltransferase